MADEKVTILEAIRIRRHIELRDLALAEYYPRIQSTTPLPAVTPYMRKQRRDSPSLPENVAKPWKKPWDK
jgi:hypothetical protein